MAKKNVNDRLLKFLQSGRDITTAQAQARFGIVNVAARVSELRADGHAIYLNERTTSNGRTIKAYRLGTPRTYGWGTQPYGGRVSF